MTRTVVSLRDMRGIRHIGVRDTEVNLYILSLSDLCLGIKKKIFKEIMHFHYMTYKATP